MESMRSLNSSLPRPAQHARRRQANSELLQAFKAAALSVTQLYKTASAEEEDFTREARNAGYVDALDDIVAFLDERNLGLGDGEGWQVREWATQRHQTLNNKCRSPEEATPTAPEEDEQRGRSTTPTMSQKPQPHYHSASVQTEPALPNPTLSSAKECQHDVPSSNNFTFRSPMAMPPHADVDMCTPTQRSPPSVRVELLPRTTRNTSHRSSHHSRNSDRTQTISFGNLGHGAGSKRKLPLHEFFDVNGVVGSKEASGKRSRHG